MYAVVRVGRDAGTRIGKSFEVLTGPHNMEVPGSTVERVLEQAEQDIAALLKDEGWTERGWAVESSKRLSVFRKDVDLVGEGSD